MAVNVPRVVIVTRSTTYESLLARHATRGQAAFFLSTRGIDIDAIERDHHAFHSSLDIVLQAVPSSWRQARVPRADLDRFLFEPDDIVVAVGQDGLVANMAKYLREQPVIGINPLPDRYDGVLVPHPPAAAGDLLHAVARDSAAVEWRTMVEARLDDGQSLLALNEIFVGHRTHQSARYRLLFDEHEERQSSSGLIVATGTGATGWARSINESRATPLPLPAPADRALAFFVREAFPSVTSATGITSGLLREQDELRVTSENEDGGAIFGDGIEDDCLDFFWGRCATVRIADVRLKLIR